MSSRERVENRAHLIYNFLVEHLGDGFTMPELCVELDIQPGSTTTTAIRHARDLATEAGYHFPPAIAANNFHYKVTNLAQDAVDPTLQMSRVEHGVRLRKEDGLEFMRRERNNLPPELRPIVDLNLKFYDRARHVMAEMQGLMDDMVVSSIEIRRGQRDERKLTSVEDSPE